MARFVFIDPSIQDYQGHYYEYARRILGAAEASGHRCVLATNRSFRESADPPIEVHPVYRFGFWPPTGRAGRLRWLTRLWRLPRQWLRSVRLKLRYSFLGLAWAYARDPQAYLRQCGPQPHSTLAIAIGAGTYYVTKVGQAGRRVLRHLIPFRRFIRALVKETRELLRAVCLPLGCLLRPSPTLRNWFWLIVKTRQFVRDTQRLFRAVPLEEGDCVFVSTTSAAELLAVARYLRSCPAARQASWHFVFRHPVPNARTGADRSLREGLLMMRAAAGNQAHYYTDTAELTTQYNRLGLGRFQTLPIPAAEDFAIGATAIRSPGPLRVRYVGDARNEKGYHYLPRLVGDLWTEYVASGRVRFDFQSNFSTPQGSPETVLARLQLESFPAEHVRLLTHSLTPAEYRALVLDADVIVLPYEQSAYQARSSGIFVEALAAGKPVVVPSGTWMALQLAPAIHAYHMTLGERARLRRAYPATAVFWMVEGDPAGRPLTQGRLRLRGQSRCFCCLPLPSEATHLLITYQQQLLEASPRFVRISVIQERAPQLRRHEKQYVVGGCRMPASLLVPLEADATEVLVAFRGAYSEEPIELDSVRMEFYHASNELPCAAGGVIFDEPDRLAAAVAEIIRHYDHYRQSAVAYARDWAAYHSAAALVRCVTGATPSGTSPTVPGATFNYPTVASELAALPASASPAP